MSQKHPRSVLSSFSSLLDAAPDRHLFIWVDDHGRESERLTVRQLAEAASSISGNLERWGFRRGDRAVLVYPPGLDFVKAFVGCLASGVIPVPVYPPNPLRLKRDLMTFQRIVDSSGARAALTNASYDRSRMMGSVAGMFGDRTQKWPPIPWHRTDGRPRAVNSSWYEPDDLNDTAFLQFTSGSTSAPKGVMVTHANLAHEIAANEFDLRLHQGTRGVFWIPQYHDMGLINVILSTVVGNSMTYLMSPLTFLQRPDVWLRTMSTVGATVTSAPNFAYELAVRKTTPLQRAGWNLSSLEMVISAAEPVQDRTVQKFLEAFAPSGIRRDVFFTAYGLAENTASVTNRGYGRVWLSTEALEQNLVRIGRKDEPTTVLHGCGRSSKAGDRIRIVDPDTRMRCAPDRVGEIWVHSSTTAAGYWGMPSLSEQTFKATIIGDDDPTEYLRTGDLGFLLDGELYVTGRIKDLMIIRGRNIHPADIEESVRACHPLIRPGGVLVFSIGPGESPGDRGDNDVERIVVTVEVRVKEIADHAAEEICAGVRRAVHADHGLACDTVVIGTAGLVKKTTSGKLRRQVCKREFLGGMTHHPSHALHVSTTSVAGRFS